MGVDEPIEINQITDHAGLVVDPTADGDFDRVVVPMSVGVIAFSVGVAVFFLGHFVAVQAMRRGEHVATGEVGFHAFRLTPRVFMLAAFMLLVFMLPRKSRRRGQVFRRRAHDGVARL